jgi:hypothetical protein
MRNLAALALAIVALVASLALAGETRVALAAPDGALAQALDEALARAGIGRAAPLPAADQAALAKDEDAAVRRAGSLAQSGAAELLVTGELRVTRKKEVSGAASAYVEARVVIVSGREGRRVEVVVREERGSAGSLEAALAKANAAAARAVAEAVAEHVARLAKREDY